MLKLSFNQKVALGFAVILLLLAISGGMSLWNLGDISRSNQRVHEIAVPVVKEANNVQILLLKLANLSALGFNANNQDDIEPYRKEFENNTQEFAVAFARLETLAQADEAMKQGVAEIKRNYTVYTDAVRSMFDAKLAVLVAKSKADESAEQVIALADDVGFAFMDIVNYQASEKRFEKDLTLAQGFANQADAQMSLIARTVRELQRTTEIERLDSARDDLDYNINDSMGWFEKGAELFKPMDSEGFIPETYSRVDRLRESLDAQPGFVDFKREQLAQMQAAWDKLGEAKQSVGKAVAGLDELLKASDAQFTRLQTALSDSLSLGFKTTIGITIILLILATQNFNSMRQAIRKKMKDLAKLNHIGGDLAAARDQDTALEQVLHAMYEKIGIEQGSVYLFNKNHELEAKAFLPPRQIEGDRPAIRFTMGQGVIGRAAESKQAIFVPDTSTDKSYVGGENEKAKALLCVPLVDKDILIGVMNFSGEVGKVNFADSDYEFVASVARSLVTTIKNIRMVEVIEEHNRNLEKKVEERTAALKQKNDDIANMLSNMHQGLFTIMDGGLIHPEYAAYLETIFETKEIANRNFTDLLFQHANLSADIVDGVTTSVASIVGEDAMMYEFNSHLLIKELTLQFPDKPAKLLELDWDPIVDESDTVTKLMVTVRDVTELKALQAEAEEQKQELMMIGEVLAVDADKFNEFIDGSFKFVDQCRAIINETQERDPEKLAELFRNMHTVKGNARTYGLKFITETVHHIENTYDLLRKNEEMEWKPQELLKELEFADRAIKKYSGIFKDKLGRDLQTSGGAKLDHQQIASLMQKIEALSGADLPPNVITIVKDTYKTLVSIESKPISKVLADVVKSVNSLARELQKPEPNIAIEDGDVYLRSESHSMLNNIFMHVMRNAMDHGIESAQERLEKGKSEQGHIWIKTLEENGAVTFAVRDDGRGLALTRIFNKAIEKGMYPEGTARPAAAEIANLIFSSGFSTAEAVTEVSGRGVGMDAVREFLRSKGGSIDVVLDDGEEKADFRGFTTYIHLPADFYVSQPAFAKAG